MYNNLFKKNDQENQLNLWCVSFWVCRTCTSHDNPWNTVYHWCHVFHLATTQLLNFWTVSKCWWDTDSSEKVFKYGTVTNLVRHRIKASPPEPKLGVLRISPHIRKRHELHGVYQFQICRCLLGSAYVETTSWTIKTHNLVPKLICLVFCLA